MQRKALTLMVLTVACIMVFMTACSQSNNQTDHSTDGTENAGATGSSNGDSSKPLTIAMDLAGGPKTPDSWTEKALEADLSENLKRTVDVQNLFLPAGSDDQKTKINLLMSDKKTMPDLLWHSDMPKEYNNWIQAGVLWDLTPYLQKYGKNILDYYSKDTLFYHWDKSGKIYRIPGDVSEPGTMTTILRKDWLDKLQLKAPTTLDEYINVLRAFTKDDPDGDGKNDTFGLSGDHNYRSLAPFFYSYGLDVENFIKQPDGSIKYGAIMPQVKDVLQILRQLYSEGIIDPRMATEITDSKVDDIFSSGTSGSFYRWVAYFNPSSSPMQSFKKLNPNGEYTYIDPVQGPDGFSSDVPDPGIGWCYIVVTKHEDDPAAAVQVLNQMASPETFKLISFGKEGEQYKIENGQFQTQITPDEKNKLGIGNYTWYIGRKDSANIANTPEVNELFAKREQTSQPMKDKIVYFKSLNRPAWDQYSADINKLRDETFWGIITGKKDISAFDDFVKQYPRLGGDKVDAEASQLFQSQADEYALYDKWYQENIEPFK